MVPYYVDEAALVENESLPPPPPSFAGAIIESHQFVHARATNATAAAAPALEKEHATDRPKRLIMTRAVAGAASPRSVTAYAIGSCLDSSPECRASRRVGPYLSCVYVEEMKPQGPL